MKVMILAAGRGERLRPLTDHTPKPLLEVGGKPLIEFHLEALARSGFTEAVVNLSWLGEQIESRLGDGSRFGLEIDYSREPEALETAGGILQALPRLGERFAVVNADIFTDYDFARLRAASAEAHLVLVPNPLHRPQGDFALHQGQVTNEGDPRYTFSGVAVYDRGFFAGLKPGKQPLAPLLRAAADQARVSGELHRGDWHDIGTVARLQALNARGVNG